MLTRVLAICTALILGTFNGAAATIKVADYSCPEFICGSGVAVFIEGVLEGDEAENLEALVMAGTVTPYSTIYFNSPGGSLFGGMGIARVIRKYNLSTGVGSWDKEALRVTGGAICMSACSLAFLGGVFRYFDDENLFGVHRFYATEPSENDGELAQVASAEIVSFLLEMDIDPDFFVEMTKAGSQSMRMLDKSQLLQMGIVNNGIGPTQWSVSASNPASGANFLYLKGERNTSFGINKLLFFCLPDGSGMGMHVIFDPQGRTEEVLLMKAIMLEIDGERHPLSDYLAIEPQIKNGWLNASFKLPARYWSAIKSGNHISIQFQLTVEAYVFLGIAHMNLNEAKSLMLGIENSCPQPLPTKMMPGYLRSNDTDFFGDDITEKGFKGISLERCEAVCNEIQHCKAYSYVTELQWCFPKFGIGKPISKMGIISGQK